MADTTYGCILIIPEQNQSFAAPLCESEVHAEYSSKANKVMGKVADCAIVCSALMAVLLFSACTGSLKGFFEVVVLNRQRTVSFLTGINHIPVRSSEQVILLLKNKSLMCMLLQEKQEHTTVESS